MRAHSLISFLIVVLWSATVPAQSTPAPSSDAKTSSPDSDAERKAPADSDKAKAKEAPEPGDSRSEQPGKGETSDSEEDGGSGEPDTLQPPRFEPPAVDVPPESAAPEEEPAADEAEMSVLSPGDAGERLSETRPEEVKSETRPWTAPHPVLTLHGYMRVRGELQDSFWLGRPALDPGRDDPFSRFVPLERTDTPIGGCGDESTLTSGGCDVDTLQFANMRLRLSPQLNLSNDVRVKMTFDMLDNIIAGTSPVSFYGDTPAATSEVLASTDNPPDDSIVVRRAWAEVRNPSLGELRFGRMPNHWGMGVLNNAGNGIDDDFSSDVDRLMGITKIVGIYLSAAYDFTVDGYTSRNESTGLPADVSQLDDVDQFTFTVARHLTPDEQEEYLESGSVVLNGGVYFSYRYQDMYVTRPDPEDDDSVPLLSLIDAETFTVDGWGDFRYRGLRVEFETAVVAGSIDNIHDAGEVPYASEAYDILSLGSALEFEYRLLSEKLGLHFMTGLATGDDDVEGLSSRADLVTQQGGSDNVTTFRFHPAYRIDLILWRSIMRQITGAYYFRPGINYDFVRSPFGQLFGARVDVIVSRATGASQTYGKDQDLGVEINASIYWRSEDGLELVDGYHAKLQWGILFPMKGLSLTGDDRPDDFEIEIPQALRLMLGVRF